MNREKLKIFGFYVLTALLLVRLVIVPYQHTIQEKKDLLKEYGEAYRVKAAAYERFKAEEKAKSPKKNETEDSLLKSAYGKDTPFISIQSEMVRAISGRAEKEGLTVVNFEFPEPTPLKQISEVPVIIRLKGEQKGIVALLKEMEKEEKKLLVERFEDGKSGQDFYFNLTVCAYRIEAGNR
jgi:hypothetical protein